MACIIYLGFNYSKNNFFLILLNCLHISRYVYHFYIKMCRLLRKSPCPFGQVQTKRSFHQRGTTKLVAPFMALLTLIGQPLCCWWLVLPIQNNAKNAEKWLKPWPMGTHLKVLSERHLMNTNKTGFRLFTKIFASLFLNESSHGIGRVNKTMA